MEVIQQILFKNKFSEDKQDSQDRKARRDFCTLYERRTAKQKNILNHFSEEKSLLLSISAPAEGRRITVGHFP